MRYLILAQSNATAEAMRLWLDPEDAVSLREEQSAPMVIEASSRERGDGEECFHRVVGWLGRALSDQYGRLHGDTVVLVDTIDASMLSGISEGMPWDHLIALLILIFPEVKWAFGLVKGVSELDEPVFSMHRFPALLTQARRDALFDPTGLRNFVRTKTNQDPASGAFKIPTRAKVIAAIDDEADYAFMHAYSAYRRGYRADVITTWALMRERFGLKEGVEKHKQTHGYALVMEDMRLMFADKPGKVHLSRLDDRAKNEHCPLLGRELDTSEWRFLVTSGQHGSKPELIRDNRAYLKEKSKGTGAILYKPVGGLHDIWDVSGLRTARQHKTWLGNAEGFQWPPGGMPSDELHAHGAPGKLALVARVLLERAEHQRPTAVSASDWIRVAVLASDAAELINGQTPTQTLVALAIKHESEVRAECTFVGTGFHFGLNLRFREIHAEVRAVCRWFQSKAWQSRLDAEATIVNRMRLVFLPAGQFEEEQQCLIKLRWLNRMMQWPLRKVWHYVSPVHWLKSASWLLLLYGEFLLGKFERLLIMTALNAIFFFQLAVNLDGKGANPLETGINVLKGFTTAEIIFGGVQHVNFGILALSVLAVSSGVFHFGILTSYLFSLISRR